MKKIICIVILSLVVAMILSSTLIGCTSTKQVNSTSFKNDSSYVQSLKDSLSMTITERNWFENQLKAIEYSSLEFDSTKCPEIIIPEDCNNDSISSLVNQLNAAINGLNNKVKYYKDGTVDAQGRIKKASFLKETQSNIISQQTKEIQLLKKQLQEKKVEVKTEYVTKEKVVKRSLFNVWPLCLLFLVIGWVLRGKFGKPLADLWGKVKF